MEYSCLKTLAKKHKSKISKLKEKHRAGKSWGIPYETKKGPRRMMIIKFSDLKRKEAFETEGGKMTDNIDAIKSRHHATDRNTLEERLRACKCELCGAEGKGLTFLKSPRRGFEHKVLRLL